MRSGEGPSREGVRCAQRLDDNAPGYCHPDAIGQRNDRALGHGPDCYLPDGGRFLDHCIGFRANGKNVAVLTQPYSHVDLDAVRRWAADRGLVLHVPPDPLASIHYPGETLFIVITQPGVEVQWLPDQDGRLADRWAARKVAA